MREKLGNDFAEEVVYVMSGGTEGVLSPHLTIFTREEAQPDESRYWGLVLGVSRTRDFAVHNSQYESLFAPITNPQSPVPTLKTDLAF